MEIARRTRSPSRAGAAVAATLAVALAPATARGLSLLDGPLTLGPGAPDLRVAFASAEKPAAPEKGGSAGEDAPGGPAPAPSLDFDLLPEPPPVAPSADDGAMRLRHRMLRAHQGIGLGLLGLQLATTVVGQLNYSDRFDGGPSTARYQATHAALAYATLSVFAVNGAIALLAPEPKSKKGRGFDRVTLHELGMAAAALGMAAEGALGIYTREREGFLNQEHYARVHLAVGYATLAAVGVAVGALVF